MFRANHRRLILLSLFDSVFECLFNILTKPLLELPFRILFLLDNVKNHVFINPEIAQNAVSHAAFLVDDAAEQVMRANYFRVLVHGNPAGIAQYLLGFLS